MKDTPNKDFVYIGIAPYSTINYELEKSNGRIRVGPAFNNIGELISDWGWTVGMYELCNDEHKPVEATIVKDPDGKPITLEKAIAKVHYIMGGP